MKVINDLIKEHKSYGEQLADVAKQGYISCSKLGMTTNDANSENFNLLCSAISKGYKILIDDVYNISTSTPYPINNDIWLEGVNGGSLVYTANTGLFDVKKNSANINVKKVKFVGDGVIFNILNNTQKLGDANFENNEFNGNMKLFVFIASTTVSPNLLEYGVDTFKFNYNVIKNTRKDFITLQNVPHKLIEFKFNRVNNFDNIILSSTISNEHLFLTEVLESKKNIIINNNNVVCDESWWHETSASLYFSLAAIEGVNLEYLNNYVEGMKSNIKVSVIDLYASCKYVNSQFNTWKNNVCFNADVNTTILMMAKSNGIKRLYKHNNFILEESFCAKYNKTYTDMNIKMYENQCSCDWDISDNNINMYALAGQYSSSEFNKFKFANNTLQVKYWKNSALVYTQNEIDIDIFNNVININDSSTFKLIMASTPNSLTAKNINIQNNNMCLYGTQYLLWHVNSVKCVIKNNKIDLLGTPADKAISYMCDFGDYSSEYNTYNSDTYLNFLTSNMINCRSIKDNITVKSYKQNLNIDTKLLTTSITSSKTFHIEFKLDVGGSNVVCKTKFTTFVESDIKKIKFINTTDSTENTYILGTTEGNNINLKFDIQPNFDLRFINSSSKSAIYFKCVDGTNLNSIDYTVKVV